MQYHIQYKRYTTKLYNYNQHHLKMKHLKSQNLSLEFRCPFQNWPVFGASHQNSPGNISRQFESSAVPPGWIYATKNSLNIMMTWNMLNILGVFLVGLKWVCVKIEYSKLDGWSMLIIIFPIDIAIAIPNFRTNPYWSGQCLRRGQLAIALPVLSGYIYIYIYIHITIVVGLISQLIGVYTHAHAYINL